MSGEADARTRELLTRGHAIAVVGLSEKAERDSNEVARYLQRAGYWIVPVNPTVPEILGEKSYGSLAAVPADIRIDLVDIFRRSEEVPPIVDAAIARRVPAVWMQLGVENAEAAQRARAAGLAVYENLCVMREHQRLGIPPKGRAR